MSVSNEYLVASEAVSKLTVDEKYELAHFLLVRLGVAGDERAMVGFMSSAGAFLSAWKDSGREPS